MDKDEPIDADAQARQTDGRGSSASADNTEQGEIDLRETVGDTQPAATAPVADTSAADDEGVVVNTERPAPPPRPDGAAGNNDRPAPPEPPPAASATEARNVAAEPVTAASAERTDTPLIDLGETIADEQNTSQSAWWKYAAAIAVPIAVAAVLLFTLAGRGDDDDLPEFTQGEGTELATGADPDTAADAEVANSAAADDAVDETADSVDDTASGTDAQDESTEAAQSDESTEGDTSAEADDTAQATTADAADDEPREAAERAEANPTEVPDPTAEPEDNGSDADSNSTAADADSDPDDATAADADSDPDETTADDETTGDDETSGDETAGSQQDDADAGEDTTGSQQDDADAGNDTSGTTGSEGTASGSITLSDRTMTTEPLVDFFSLTAPDGDPYDSFTTIEHASGLLAVSAPTAFTFVDAGPDAGNEIIVASTEDGASLDTPALTIRRITDGDLDELEDILAESGPGLVADCTVLTTQYELPAPAGYEGLFFADRLIEDDGVRGSIIFYESCLYGEEPTSIVEAGLIDEQGDMVIISVNVATSAELELLDRILSTVSF